MHYQNQTYLIGSEPKTTPLQLKAAIALSACENEANKSSEPKKKKRVASKQIVGKKILETCITYNKRFDRFFFFLLSQILFIASTKDTRS